MSSKFSKTEAPTELASPETVTVGRILRPHGVRGELKVEVMSDVPDRFAPGSRLLVSKDGGVVVERTVETVRAEQGKFAVVRLEGVADRDAAEALRDSWLEVPRSAVPAAAEGEYYQYELIGCRCTDGDDELGTVIDVLEDGGGLLLIVEGKDGRLPIPFVRGFLRRVDVAARTIELELPPGLVEACASRS